ncbi:MAG: type II toxin-antitoxin system mRNA interferase toxin, RelE/StbE family [Epsilonproteobacteria bacterium]|nr:MAG: type II toxin-antitoxin system mRNA interferase toxin, RelE/StbE family [Campylobacterota bacterium]
MTYRLKFTKESNKEWGKLNTTIVTQFKKKLKKRLENPRVPKDKLSGYENVYKIKLRNAGFRLAYEVKDDEIVVLVLHPSFVLTTGVSAFSARSVGKRENNSIYNNLKSRTK